MTVQFKVRVSFDQWQAQENKLPALAALSGKDTARRIPVPKLNVLVNSFGVDCCAPSRATTSPEALE
jgi:hypothetical protein